MDAPFIPMDEEPETMLRRRAVKLVAALDEDLPPVLIANAARLVTQAARLYRAKHGEHANISSAYTPEEHLEDAAPELLDVIELIASGHPDPQGVARQIIDLIKSA